MSDHEDDQEALLKTGCQATLTAFERLGWGPSMCVSNKFPDDSDAAGQEPGLWKIVRECMEKCPACVNLAVGRPRACGLQLNLDFGKVLGRQRLGPCSEKQHSRGEACGLETKLADVVSFHSAGVDRSLQTPGARGPPGEAGNRSHGH